MDNKLKNIVIVVMAIIILLLGGYLIFDKVMNNVEDEKQQENATLENVQGNHELEQTQQEQNTDNCAKVVPKCSGTYYGEASGSYANGISYNYKYTYVLKEDGTFTADFGGVSGKQGTFVINGNTISLTGTKEIAGPQDPHYSTGDYVIADDCSYILYDREINFKLLKQ